MRYAVIREGDHLAHAQHAGYYSPNNGSGNDYKRDRYLFQGVFRVENHGDAEIDLINSRDNSQARTKVPGRIIESGKTAIVNYLVRKSNSHAAIDAGQAKLAADAIERYVQQHFNTELHHSDDDDDVIETDDYLEHAQRGFYLGFDKDASVEYTFYYMSDTADANRGVVVELAPKNRIDAITVNTSNHMSVSISPFDFQRARNIQAMKNIFLSAFNTRKRERGLPNIFVTDSEASSIAAKLWIVKTDTMGLNLKEKPKKTKESKSVAGQHAGYYSPNLRHSYTVIPASEELYHFGTLGMKWGVRRYQNADGSLTEEGKKRYTNKDGSYVDNESRQAIKKEISKRKGMAGASSVLGSALISSVILNPAVLAMPVAGLVLPAAIAATSAASLINNIKSMQLSQIKDRADMIDFHRSGNEPEEPIRVNVRRR